MDGGASAGAFPPMKTTFQPGNAVWRGLRTALGALLLATMLLLPTRAPAADLMLKDGRPFCDVYKCSGFLPEADSFRKANIGIPVLEALKGGKLYAYVFLSVDLVNIPAYSGKPLVTMIAMSPQGTILKSRVVHHDEPILLLGIPSSVLDVFTGQYIGHQIRDHFEVVSKGRLSVGVAQKRGEKEYEEHAEEKHEEKHEEHAPAPAGGAGAGTTGLARQTIQVDMITGATVTALTLDETQLAAARKVGRVVGLLPPAQQRIVTWHADYQPKTWDALVAEGSVGHLRVMPQQMDVAPQGDLPWIDLYFGDVTEPVTGANILGRSTYDWLKGELKPHEHAIFVVANGMTSFKGSAFVRGGIFDRFRIEQGLYRFTFHDLDYNPLYGVKAEGAPKFKESGLFIQRDSRFDPTLPWSFVFVGSRLTGETATSKEFKNFPAPYRLPTQYYDVKVIQTAAHEASVAQRVWVQQWPEALALALFLAATFAVFFARRWITRNPRRLEAAHVSVMVASVVVVGLIFRTPPSVTQIFPFVRWFREGVRFELFLSDPLLFVFWIFIAASLVLWGRGWFCGWVCPYGAMLELLHRVSRRVLPRRMIVQFPPRVHNVLRRLRYVIFLVLLGFSVFSLNWAERLAEVEPFKTTWIVGVFHRDWYLVLYWWVLLAAGVFVFRFFCRYLCPLGAALSALTVFRLIGIRRREFCTACKICARGCDSQAIDDQGRINKFECLYCLECEQKYYDDKVCPPLVVARRKGAEASQAYVRNTLAATRASGGTGGSTGTASQRPAGGGHGQS